MIHILLCCISLKEHVRPWWGVNVDEVDSDPFLRYIQEHTFCYSDTLGVSHGRQAGRQRSRVFLEFEIFFEDFL